MTIMSTRGHKNSMIPVQRYPAPGGNRHSPDLAEDQSPIQMVGSSMFSTSLFQYVTSTAMCINMVICLMNLVGMGIAPPGKWPPHPCPPRWRFTLNIPLPFIGCAGLSLFGIFTWMCFICLMLFPYYSYIIVGLLVTPMAVFFCEYWTGTVPLG